MKFLLRCIVLSVLSSLAAVSFATASSPSMKLKGSLFPWEGVFGAVVVDANRGVAYMGTVDDPARGVAVIDIRNRNHPVLSMDLGPPPNAPGDQSTSTDVHLVGRYLLVSHHQMLGHSFVGVSVYDISADPFHPTLVRRVPVPASCGLESAELDPEVESGRPYAYCNAHCIIDGGVYTVNILTGEVLSRFVSPEGLNCPPFPCTGGDNLPHESFVQRHPTSGRMLLYVGFWDSGLRIVDVTDPRHPAEVGSFDYGPGTPNQNAHGAVATPSGNWIYVGDEFGVGEAPGGGVHIFDAHACDGTAYCTPTQVGFYHAAGDPVLEPNPGDFYSDFGFDVHNMTPRGENTLLLGHYGYGIRLVDTSVKSAPAEISSYLPDPAQFPWAPLTWVAVFGSDGLVYASDIRMGLFIVKSKDGAQAVANPGISVSIGSGASGSHRFAFSTTRDGPISLTVFDVAGRRIALVADRYSAAGSHTLTWDGLSTKGHRVPSGLYFARLSTPEGQNSAKLLHVAP